MCAARVGVSLGVFSVLVAGRRVRSTTGERTTMKPYKGIGDEAVGKQIIEFLKSQSQQ
jgi:hypothetical protein